MRQRKKEVVPTDHQHVARKRDDKMRVTTRNDGIMQTNVQRKSVTLHLNKMRNKIQPTGSGVVAIGQLPILLKTNMKILDSDRKNDNISRNDNNANANILL
jgi:hypothetical protein